MPKIILSDTAYMELLTLLNNYKNEYDCIKLSSYKTCCKNFSVDIILDNFSVNQSYFSEKIKDITFIYDKTVNTNINTIKIIYDNSSFMVKILSNKHCNKNNCSTNCTRKGSCPSCNKCGK